MTKATMQEVLLHVRMGVDDSMMRAALGLAAGLVISRLLPERRTWLVPMLRDMSYDCDCRSQVNYAELLREVASALESN
jgi:hypothetical protein